ncbi:hypothetical protein ACIQVK_22890 [Streptomyces sp. NPDC090493]|uniref:hypothetical protein n=1 Tax=Streptomyces sp. NPDC090493 TaxID=3365964 RepID=UPI003821A263
MYTPDAYEEFIKSSYKGAQEPAARYARKRSADPDGPARQPGLPDGLSTCEQNVTVKEIQAVNR